MDMVNSILSKQEFVEIWWVAMVLLLPMSFVSFCVRGPLYFVRARMTHKTWRGIAWTLFGGCLAACVITVGLALSVCCWKYQPLQDFMTAVSYDACAVTRTASFDMVEVAAVLMTLTTYVLAIPCTLALFGWPIARLSTYLIGRVKSAPRTALHQCTPHCYSCCPRNLLLRVDGWRSLHVLRHVPRKLGM